MLTQNETEAEYITGIKINDRSNALKAIHWLINRGVKEVIVTLGKKGALYLNQDQDEIYQPAFSVKVVDTTAAGDTFIGTFMAMRDSNFSTEDSLRFASAAAALTVTRQGAQSSIPTIAEVEAFISEKVG
ncbi:MAG: PfkB family carbohydrate kinase [Bacillota bacterium]